MRFKDVFSIIGPGMVGPSSSHTAGAVRIGRAARQLFGRSPERAEIELYRSFADTYRGHGTNVALAAGLLDWDTDDERIPEALTYAQSMGLALTIRPSGSSAPHPNTAVLRLYGAGESLKVMGTSIGGGNIEIVGVDDFDVRFSGMYPTMLVRHTDRVGMLAEITRLFSACGLNIGSMDCDRSGRGGEALTVLESDGAFPGELLEAVRGLAGVISVRMMDLAGGDTP